MCPGAQGSFPDLEWGWGQGGRSPLTQRSWAWPAGSRGPSVSQMCHRCLPKPCSTLWGQAAISQFTWFANPTSGPANLASSQCFPPPWMPPVPQTSASRSLGITCRPRLHIPGSVNLTQFAPEASLKYARSSDCHYHHGGLIQGHLSPATHSHFSTDQTTSTTANLLPMFELLCPGLPKWSLQNPNLTSLPHPAHLHPPDSPMWIAVALRVKTHCLLWPTPASPCCAPGDLHQALPPFPFFKHFCFLFN